MTQDRGDDLSPGDARAIELSERAAYTRGVRLNDSVAREYAARPLLSMEEAAAIVQGLVPLLPGTLRVPQYLLEFACEVARLQRDVAAGALAMPCTPVELIGWARALHLELPSAFEAALQPPEGLPSPPAVKPRAVQQDRYNCQARALEIWPAKRLTIEKMMSEPAIAKYVTAYSADTVRKWLSKVDPRDPEHKPGPRRRMR